MCGLGILSAQALNLAQTVRRHCPRRHHKLSRNVLRQSAKMVSSLVVFRSLHDPKQAGGNWEEASIDERARGGISLWEHFSVNALKAMRVQEDCYPEKFHRRESGIEMGFAGMLFERDALTGLRLTGQRSQDSPHLLQGQDLQKAHPTQGHPIQGRKGSTHLAPYPEETN